jgi:hypothetical protein
VKLDDVSSIQVADETFVAADPAAGGEDPAGDGAGREVSGPVGSVMATLENGTLTFWFKARPPG